MEIETFLEKMTLIYYYTCLKQFGNVSCHSSEAKSCQKRVSCASIIVFIAFLVSLTLFRVLTATLSPDNHRIFCHNVMSVLHRSHLTTHYTDS